MLGWATLKWWQRSLALLAIVYFSVAYAWIGGPARHTIPGWMGYAGSIAIICAMVLNPASFGGGSAGRSGWAGLPTVCKYLLAGGLVAILVSQVAFYYSVFGS